MNYKEEIKKVKKNLKSLKKRKNKFIKILKTLNIGDEIYKEGSYGDFFPQKVLEVDLDKCEVKVHEESINIIKNICSFHKFEDGEYKLYF